MISILYSPLINNRLIHSKINIDNNDNNSKITRFYYNAVVTMFNTNGLKR